MTPRAAQDTLKRMIAFMTGKLIDISGGSRKHHLALPGSGIETRIIDFETVGQFVRAGAREPLGDGRLLGQKNRLISAV